MTEPAVVPLEAMADRMETDQPDGALLAGFTRRRPSVEERLAAGKAMRKKVSRQAHRAFEPGPGRIDPLEILERQNATRAQKLVPVRYGRMLASPFAYLRGSAAVMASDLATTPATGIQVNACGDMHVSNFGVFGSAERDLVFAINDFDEVFPGAWEWDLKRLTASAAVAVRFMGGDKHQAAEAAAETVRSYREHIARYAEMGHLATWYDRIDERAVLSGLSSQARKNARKLIAKARAKGHQRVLGKLAELVEGEHRIVESVPLVVRETHTDGGTPIDQALDAMLNSYLESLTYDRRRLLSRYRIVDVARKVVGVGSVGTGCWVDSDDPLFLQVKEAVPSVLEPYVGKSEHDNHGQRVVVGQRLMQSASDLFLGWTSGEDGRARYVRQLRDMKISPIIESFEASDLKAYGRICAWALARAHARSGDPAMIAGYMGGSEVFDDAIADFAVDYADQAQRDYRTFVKAIRQGRLKARRLEE